MHQFPRQGQSGSGFLPCCGSTRANGNALAMVAPAEPGGSDRINGVVAPLEPGVSAVAWHSVEGGGVRGSAVVPRLSALSAPSSCITDAVSHPASDGPVQGPCADGKYHYQHEKANQGLSVQSGLYLSLPRLDVHGSSPKKSNLDATGTRLVRKGCVVEYPLSGCTARVVKVRSGQFWPAGKADGAPSFVPCSAVRVVA